MATDFESSRIFRPRLLIHGRSGLGQQYLAAAVLNHMENVHVQSFDLAALMGDATRVGAFCEVDSACALLTGLVVSRDDCGSILHRGQAAQAQRYLYS